MKKILILMLTVAMLVLCLTACGDNEGTDNTTKGAESFGEVLSLRGIDHTMYQFSTPDRVAYASQVTEETVDVVELGYDGQTVSELVKTFYMNVEQYDVAQRTSVKESMENSFSKAEGIAGVTITHNLTDKYYIMKIEIKGLNDPSVADEVNSAGILDFAKDTRLEFTVKALESALLSNGYIKK